MLARALGGVAVLLLILMPPVAARADKLTEANMTHKDYDELTKTETSAPGEKPEPFSEMHDFSAADEQAMKEAHAVRVIKGKDWKAASPKDRDKKLRELRKTLKPGTLLMLEVPSGNVWAVDPLDADRLEQDKVIRLWKSAEIDKLPEAVRRDPATSHSDRRGTGLERALTREEEP